MTPKKRKPRYGPWAPCKLTPSTCELLGNSSHPVMEMGIPRLTRLHADGPNESTYVRLVRIVPGEPFVWVDYCGILQEFAYCGSDVVSSGLILRLVRDGKHYTLHAIRR